MNAQSLSSYENILQGVSTRYREEIDKLDMKKSEIIRDFKRIGLSNKTFYNWYDGTNFPRIEGLLLLAHYGGDVQYVVTGVSSRNLTEVKAHMQDLEPDSNALLVREAQEILRIIEQRLDDSDRQQHEVAA